MLAALLLSGFMSAAHAAVDLQDFSGTLEFDPGYRRDSLSWSQGFGYPGTPNPVTAMTWKRLLIWEFDIRTRVEYKNSAVSKMKLGFGGVDAGTNQVSDFAGPGTTQEWSRSQNDAKFGHTFDFSLGFGYKLMFGRRNDLTVIPLLGYSYYKQNLSMRYGTQVLSSCPPSPPFPAGTCAPPLGNIAGLDSHFNALWTGPWLGIDLEEETYGHFFWGGGIEYHFNAKYKGSGNWNVGADPWRPTTYTQNAKAQATVVNLSVRYAPNRDYSIGLVGERKEFATGPGSDSTASPSGSYRGSLGKARWQSMTGTLSFLIRH